MGPKKKAPPNEDRARKTLYVTGFNPKLMKRHLLKELFTQGGPVTDVTLFETHAYVLFQHFESVPYCLALFQDVEIFGDKLRLKPRCHTAGNPYTYLDYLTEVRGKLRDEYSKSKPPSLPAKKYPDDPKRKNENTRRRSRTARPPQGRNSDHHNKSATTPPEVGYKHSPAAKKAKKGVANRAATSSKSTGKKRKQGGKRKTVGTRKLQKQVRYIV